MSFWVVSASLSFAIEIYFHALFRYFCFEVLCCYAVLLVQIDTHYPMNLTRRDVQDFALQRHILFHSNLMKPFSVKANKETPVTTQALD